jgi:hypothetical protein
MAAGLDTLDFANTPARGLVKIPDWPGSIPSHDIPVGVQSSRQSLWPEPDQTVATGRSIEQIKNVVPFAYLA